jgi:predicted nucleotidyltransferase
VIIGASALGYYYEMTWRQTFDLDLTVAVNAHELEVTLALQSTWRRDQRLKQRWISPLGVLVDLIPASAELIAAGVLDWGDGYEMSVCGLDLAHAHAERKQESGGLIVNVAPPAVITVLKMVAYLDRPDARRKDLDDIAWLLHSYLDEDSDRRWEEGAAYSHDFDAVSAYLLGFDIGRVLSPAHSIMVERFMTNDLAWGTLGQIGAPQWRREDEPGATPREAMRAGLCAGAARQDDDPR